MVSQAALTHSRSQHKGQWARSRVSCGPQGCPVVGSVWRVGFVPFPYIAEASGLRKPAGHVLDHGWKFAIFSSLLWVLPSGQVVLGTRSAAQWAASSKPATAGGLRSGHPPRLESMTLPQPAKPLQVVAAQKIHSKHLGSYF